MSLGRSAVAIGSALGVAALVWMGWSSDEEETRGSPVHDGAPSWSPDGSRIVFHSNRDGNGEIYVMNADGAEIRRLTHHEASDGDPSWSPDGTKILFDSDRGGTFDIWVMNADASDPRQLTEGPGRDLAPAWSPDGERIAFMSDQVGAFQIYVMDADGGNQRRMTMIYTNWFPR